MFKLWMYPVQRLYDIRSYNNNHNLHHHQMAEQENGTGRVATASQDVLCEY